MGVIKETAISIGEFIAKYLPFPGENIGLVLLIILALFISAKITSYIPPIRDKSIPWLIIAGILVYLGWFF
jgi:hypothetical protein